MDMARRTRTSLKGGLSTRRLRPNVETLRKTNPKAVVQEVLTAFSAFGLNLRVDKPPFNDVRVRRAMSMAIDRQKQVDTLFEGHAVLGWGIPYFYWQDELPSASDLGPYWQYRPEEAKKLLAEAGHANGFETTLFYYEYNPQMTSQIQLVQQDLKRNLNIELKITKTDYTTYFGRYAEGKWDGTAWGFQTGYAVSRDDHLPTRGVGRGRRSQIPHDRHGSLYPEREPAQGQSGAHS